MKKEAQEIKNLVKQGYGKIAKQGTSCCSSNSCCGGGNSAEKISKSVGYGDEEMKAVPEGANLGLGCGNPTALTAIKEGDVVLDLGSGAGFDCFLAANKVGKTGKVIGIDMTPEMIARARENAKKANYTNVEFRLGEIEHLPVEANFIDIIISNCVINLSPDKKTVFKEAFRVLKPKGRLMISDLVIIKELPEKIKESVYAYVGCLAGAVLKTDYIDYIKTAGFKEVKIVSESFFPVETMANDATAQAIIEGANITPEEIKELGKSVASIKVSAVKF